MCVYVYIYNIIYMHIFQIAQLVKDPPAMQETPVRFLDQEDPTPVFLGFPGGSDSKESAYNVGDLGLIPVGKIPWRRNGDPLQYSCLENPYGQRSLAGYSPWGHKEMDKTE